MNCSADSHALRTRSPLCLLCSTTNPHAYHLSEGARVILLGGGFGTNALPLVLGFAIAHPHSTVGRGTNPLDKSRRGNENLIISYTKDIYIIIYVITPFFFVYILSWSTAFILIYIIYDSTRFLFINPVKSLPPDI